MRTRPFHQVDVFSKVPTRGNPVAVVHDADDLTEEKMQLFARWMNLSETTFLLKPTLSGADYRVRIFTPAIELSFAGHPTLGTCRAWLQRAGRDDQDADVVQQCQVGLVRVRVRGNSASFAAPTALIETVEADLLLVVVKALGLEASKVRAAAWLDNGSRWLGLSLDSAESVRALKPHHASLKDLCKVGVVGRNDGVGECLFEVRAFAAYVGVPEDPVTGSLNASMAQWLIDRGDAPNSYVVAQGTQIGRDGRVRIVKDGETLWVGGDCSVCISGNVNI